MAKEKGQKETTIYKTLSRRQKIEQGEAHLNGVELICRVAVHAPLVRPVMLL